MGVMRMEYFRAAVRLRIKPLENGDAQETILALPNTLRVAATDQIVNAVERILGAGVMYFR